MSQDADKNPIQMTHPQQPQPTETCPTCNGSGLYGYVHGRHMPCPACEGTGTTEKRPSFPKDVSQGHPNSTEVEDSSISGDEVEQQICKILIQPYPSRDGLTLVAHLPESDQHVRELVALFAHSTQQAVVAALEGLPTSIELSRSALNTGPVLPPDDPGKDTVYVAGVPLRAVTAAIARAKGDNVK